MENQMNKPPRGIERTCQNGGYGGNAMVEVLERTRRIETRLTNTMRSLGLQPGLNTPNPLKGTVGYVYRVNGNDELLVTSPDVPISEIGTVAVRNTPTGGGDKTFTIVLCNQVWGEITIRGAIPQEVRDKR